VAWDTQFSPVDVRTLAQRHRTLHGTHLVFDRQADGRSKTGRAAIGTVSARTERLVIAYLDKLGVDLHPDAILFRNRSGNPYRPDTLSDDFADVRELTFPGDKRRLSDIALYKITVRRLFLKSQLGQGLLVPREISNVEGNHQ
jgi:hypothetical protein